MSLILDLFYPVTCYGCGQKGEYLCSRCRSTLPLIGLHHQRIISLYPYSSFIKYLLVDLKYHFVTDLVFQLAQTISQDLIKYFPNLVDYWQQNHFVLTSIPLHFLKQNWRGFNQSSLISQELAKLLKLDYQELIIRHQFTSPQANLKDPSARRANMSSVFAIKPPLSRGGPEGGGVLTNLIIFDDVYTTGATLNSAISIFPKNSEIYGLTLAA
ncbi:MAG TPA: hypothetical protein PK370_01745 [Candidatus Woesebacteria bacterium]|nr:hypothetical protein [Candidatus Woesebacteria bacterium]HPJ16621.1 hypothetical protein [Candidatus Woesebacteria bacterium]